MPHRALTRRAFCKRSVLALSGGALAGQVSKAWAAQTGADAQPILRMGLLTDIHYADRDRRGSRYYRDSLTKIKPAVDKLNTLGIDQAAQLGDFIDSGDDLESEIDHLKTIEAAYARVNAPRHYVLGNHCVHRLTKDEFMHHSGMDKPYKSFDVSGVRFIILDACFTSSGEPYQRRNFKWTDANLPAEQLEWFEARLRQAPGPAVVLTHQRIDGLKAPYNVNNHAKARAIMREAGNVLAVLSGHSHSNLHAVVGGIDFVVLRAMVEGAGLKHNSFGRLLIYDDHSLAIEGYVQQAAVHCSAP
jgi:alkaline phosphatase